jgi:hypothetical protein
MPFTAIFLEGSSKTGSFLEAYIKIIYDATIEALVRNTVYHKVNCTECQSFLPIVRLGPPPPSPASEYSPPFGSKGGGALACRVREGGGIQFRRRDRHSGTLCSYTKIPLSCILGSKIARSTSNFLYNFDFFMLYERLGRYQE